MMGMEKMVAGMLGISPGEMQAMATGLSKAATEAVELLRTIDSKLTSLNSKMEAMENGHGK